MMEGIGFQHGSLSAGESNANKESTSAEHEKLEIKEWEQPRPLF
jgi:hypothetical protein